MKDNKRSFRQKAGDFLSGRGFYIALSACVLVIGISAWAMLVTGSFGDRTDVGDGNNTSLADMQNNDDESQNTIKLPIINKDDEPKDEDKPEDGTDGEQTPDASTPETPQVSEPETPTEAPVDEGTAAETMAQTDPDAVPTFMWPIYGEVAVGYFKDELVYNKTMMDWRTHSAVDISADIGAKVMAVADGTVSQVYNDDLMGTTVVIDHSAGLQSVYSNLAGTPTVNVGDAVTMSSVIGAVGNTAIGETGEVAHLHFAMMKDGETVSPMEYLPTK